MKNTTRAGSKGLIRDLNRSLVLNIIANDGPISRVEVARRGGLTAATITNIVNDFIEAGLVYETASEESSGGRPPILLRISPSAGYVVGVKVREYKITVALCDLECNEVCHTERTLSQGTQPYQLVEIITEAFEHCLKEVHIHHHDILGMGVAISGIVDACRGVLRYSNLLGWHNTEIGPALEYKTRIPVNVDNDVNMLALAESYFSTALKNSIFAMVTIGQGIGMGLIIDGELYRGANGSAAEFGHMTVDNSPTAASCTCGKKGCLEAIVSDYGIAHAALHSKIGYADEAMMQQLLARARAGDEQIQAIYHRAGTILGIALANLINLFDPAQIVLAGEGLRAGDFLLEPVREILPQHLFNKSRPEIPLIISSYDDVKWARGAASVVLREVFRPPIYETGKVLPIDMLLSRERSRVNRP